MYFSFPSPNLTVLKVQDVSREIEEWNEEKIRKIVGSGKSESTNSAPRSKLDFHEKRDSPSDFLEEMGFSSFVSVGR